MIISSSLLNSVSSSRIEAKIITFRGVKYANPSICSITISCAAIFFLVIFADCFIANLSLHSIIAFGTENCHDVTSTRKGLESKSARPLLLIQEYDEECYGEDKRNQNNLIAPVNVTEEERITWFKKKLPEFHMLETTKLAEQFDRRVREFFDRDCSNRFFMTWISPAQLYGSREIIAMETLFKSHPDGCLLILSTTMDSACGYKIIKPILDRGFKILPVSPDMPFLFKNTPAEAWFAKMKTGGKDPGEIPLAQNLSNLIRLAALYRYGGVYLDTDFVVLKEFTELRNSIGAQSMDSSGNWTRLNNAVLIFDRKHPLLYKFLEEFALTFDGNKWGHNGPYLVSRVVARISKRHGYNFTVLPPMAFYPVDWTRIGGLFKQPEDGVDSKWVEAKLLQLKGEPYGIHLWNKQSSRLRIKERSIIGQLISNNCIICDHVYSSRRVFT